MAPRLPARAEGGVVRLVPPEPPAAVLHVDVVEPGSEPFPLVPAVRASVVADRVRRPVAPPQRPPPAPLVVEVRVQHAVGAAVPPGPVPPRPRPRPLSARPVLPRVRVPRGLRAVLRRADSHRGAPGAGVAVAVRVGVAGVFEVAFQQPQRAVPRVGGPGAAPTSRGRSKAAREARGGPAGGPRVVGAPPSPCTGRVPPYPPFVTEGHQQTPAAATVDRPRPLRIGDG